MRVLKIADAPRDMPGGIRSFVLRTGAVLEDMGHGVEYIFRDDLHVGLLRRRRARRLAIPWLVAWEVIRRRQRYDVIDIQEQAASVYCRIRRVVRALPPCVVSSWGAEERYWREYSVRARRVGFRQKWGKGLYKTYLIGQSRAAFRHADHILVPSDDDLQYLRDELKIPAERMTRVDSGVDDEYFDVPRRNGRETMRFAFVGAWCDKKGSPEVVEAWRRLSPDHGSVSLTALCTVASEAEVLEDFGDACGRVSVQPFATDAALRDALSVHDVFVLPSWFEGGMSLASQQAASAGLACVVTAISGHSDLFRLEDPEADGALVVPPHDVDALTEALARLMKDRDLVARLGTNARQRARQFTWRETVRLSLEGYEGALGRSDHA